MLLRRLAVCQTVPLQTRGGECREDVGSAPHSHRAAIQHVV